MSVTTEVKKYADTARGQFSEQLAEARKPLFAVVGAGDVAVEQARELPAEVKALRSRLEDLPEQVKALRGRVEDTATQLGGSASSLYSELTVRGERVYTSLRGSEAKPAQKAQAKAGAATREGASTVKSAAGSAKASTGKDTPTAARKAVNKAADKAEAGADKAEKNA